MGFGKIGGFGNMTRLLAQSLTKEGHNVVVLVPKKENQKSSEEIDGYQVIGLSKIKLFSLKIYKQINADLYHSQNPTIFTYLSQLAQPNKLHVVTIRDPRNFKDMVAELRYVTFRRKFQKAISLFFETGFLVKRAVLKADAVGTPGFSLISKSEKLFKRDDIIMLPNIVSMPKKVYSKATNPTVCFVGRLDQIKNPERMIKLAKSFPQTNFLVVGTAQDNFRQKKLEKEMLKYPNIKYFGYIDKFSSDDLNEIYSKSHILVNTSIKEALPATFIEALSFGCSILSSTNADKFAELFGYYCEKDAFEKGLMTLFKNNLWHKKGLAGFEYVKQHYDYPISIKKHLLLYQQLTNKKNQS